MPAPTSPWGGTSSRLRPTLIAAADGGDREVELRAAGPSQHHDQHHEERVEGDAGRDQRHRLVGRRRTRARPARARPSAPPATARARRRREQQEVGDDERVRAPRLVVVADRVGKRRPGEVEGAHHHRHDLAELDRQRVEARLRQPDEAHQHDAVDEVERVERQLGGHRRQAEAQHRAQQRRDRAQRQSPPVRRTRARSEHRPRCRRSCRAAARARPRPPRRRARR